MTALLQEVILVTDPDIHWRTLILSLVNGVGTGVLLYIRQHPLPDEPPTTNNNNENKSNNDSTGH